MKLFKIVSSPCRAISQRIRQVRYALSILNRSSSWLEYAAFDGLKSATGEGSVAKETFATLSERGYFDVGFTQQCSWNAHRVMLFPLSSSGPRCIIRGEAHAAAPGVGIGELFNHTTSEDTGAPGLPLRGVNRANRFYVFRLRLPLGENTAVDGASETGPWMLFEDETPRSRMLHRELLTPRQGVGNVYVDRDGRTNHSKEDHNEGCSGSDGNRQEGTERERR